MVLKQLGMASVSIQAGVEGFLELEPNSNTCFLSGRTVTGQLTKMMNSVMMIITLKAVILMVEHVVGMM